MLHISFRQIWIALTITPCIALGALLGNVAIGQDADTPAPAVKTPAPEAAPAPAPEAAPAPVPEAAPAQKPEPAKAKREFKGRLPIYYGEVVDPKQRKAIYSVQLEYAPQIEALKDQLVALIKQRNAKVEAVLTAEQLAEVEALRAAAKEKRAKAKEEAAKAKAAKTPSS